MAKNIMQSVKMRGFTIVELLVVIVVIGILAAITIVSYSGISNKAIAASLQSDLDNSSKQLKMYYVEHGYYPSSLDSNLCPLDSSSAVDPRYCLKASGTNVYDYSPVNYNNPTGFNLTSSSSNGMVYAISDNMTSRSISGNLSVVAAPISTSTGPQGITISPDGVSVYAANQSANTISMYARNANTGALTSLATPTITAGTGPLEVIVSLDGVSAYASNINSNNISMYSRNPSTGLLTALATPTIATGTAPRGIAVTSDGMSVYVVNSSSNNISMYSRNPSTGLLTALATPTIATGIAPLNIVVSPDGTSVYAVNNNTGSISMYSRNISTGVTNCLSHANDCSWL